MFLRLVLYGFFGLFLPASLEMVQPVRGGEVESFQKQALFTSGEGGYQWYRIPSLLTTSKPGIVLAFAEGRHELPDNSDIDLVMKRSTDGGQSWSGMQVIANYGGLTVNNPCPVFDHSTGTISLVFCRGTQPGGDYMNKEVLVMNSTDDGRTWSAPVDITSSAMDPGWTWVFAGPGHGIQLSSERLLIPCAAEADGIQFSFMLYSNDHGTTWQRSETLTPSASDECDVVELNDGRIYMNGRSRNQLQRAYAYSSDDGSSWTDVLNHLELPESEVDGGLAYLPDESAILVTRAANPALGNRRDMTVSLSSDDGATWPISRLIHAGPAAYSDLAVMPGGEILCFYEGGEKFRYETLTLARFDLAWVENGARRKTSSRDAPGTGRGLGRKVGDTGSPAITAVDYK